MVFASMRAERLFLRARAMIKFVLRATSTLEYTDGEQRAIREFSTSRNLSFIERKHCFALRGSTNPRSLQPIRPCLR